MNQSFWTIILVTGLFIGFLVGYSLAPMVNVEKEPQAKQTSGEDMQSLYKKLSQEAGAKKE